MRVFVLTETQLRMGCLSTLLRFVDLDPTTRVEFVKSLPPTMDGDDDEYIFILKPDAEIRDVQALVSSPPGFFPFVSKGVSDLRLTDEGVSKTYDWYLIGLQRAHWESLTDITKFPPRHVPMNTSVDFTFHGDVGQRNLLKIR